MNARVLITLFTVASLLELAACSSTPKPAKCDENKGVYLQAQNNPLLKVPEGDASPDHRGALTIPAGNGKQVDTKACLQRSPSYFGTAGRIAASPEEMVGDWAQAWADRNSAAVMSMYASSFSTDAPAGKEGWLTQRGNDIANGPVPNGRVTQLKVISQGNDERVASFIQTFGTTRVHKQLTLVRDAGVWKISAERVTSTDTQPAK
jgi:hypothetical protein